MLRNGYKAVIPRVSGIAYVENPIPELVKGSRTPYRRYTSDWEFLAPPSRDRAFEKAIAQEVGGWEHEVSVFRALGSGKHWVGVMYWFRQEMEDYTLVSLAATLQSGRSWAVAENKVLRWIKSPRESKGHYDETGAGQVTFLRWVFDRVKDDVKSMQQVMDTYKGTYALKPKRMAVGWGDPKRERAYAYLTRLGFTKVADSGDGDPAYILDIKAPRKNPLEKPSPTLAVAVTEGRWYNSDTEDEFPEVKVLLFDTAASGLAALIGGISVRQGRLEEDMDRWFVDGAAAYAGYGPLLYDLAAIAVGAPISPSGVLSKHAQRFWSRRPDARIRNLSYEEFQAKYGVPFVPMRTAPKNAPLLWDAVENAFAYGKPLEVVTKMKPSRKNPTDLAGRHIPERYLAGLPTKLQQQRVRELTQSRDDYWKGDYSELPTDRAARKMGLVKQSPYTTVAKARGIEWRGDPRDMAARVLSHYGGRPTSGEVQRLADALRQSFAKGLAAWKSGGHRPGATAQNWAVARVNSLVVGGKTAWTADKKQFASIPEAIRRVIASKLSEVKAALRAQGRTADVEFLQGAAKANPLETDDSRLLVLSLNVGRRSEQTVADVIIERSEAWARNLAITAGSSAQRRQQVQEEVAQTAVEGAIGYLMKVLDEEEIGQLAGILRKKSRLTEAEAEVISDVGMKVSAALGSAVEAGKKAALRQRKIEEMGDVGRMAEARRAVDFVRLEASAKRRLALRGKRATPANIADYMDMTLEEYQARKLEHTKPRYTTLEVHPELSEDEDVESEAGEKIGIATVEDRALAVQRDLQLKAAHDSLIEAVDQLVGPGREYDHRSTGGQALLSMRALYEEGEDPTSPENITIIARRSGLLDKAKIKAIQTEALDLAGAILTEKVRQLLSASELPALYGGEKVTKAIPERKNRRQR